MTLSVAQKVKINEESNNLFIGLNILAMMPALAKFTFFSKNLEADDETFLENDDNNKTLFKR